MVHDDDTAPREQYLIDYDPWAIERKIPAVMPDYQVIEAIQEMAPRLGFGPARIRATLLRKYGIDLSEGEIVYLRKPNG